MFRELARVRDKVRRAASYAAHWTSTCPDWRTCRSTAPPFSSHAIFIISTTLPLSSRQSIALDWLPNRWSLTLMRWLAAAARWPAVWRRGSAWRINRAGYSACLELLTEGRLLLVFPEGYPTIDRLGPTRSHEDAFLPFEPGFLVLTERCVVPLIPVGLSYVRSRGDGWSVWLRFGLPVMHARNKRNRRAALVQLERAVRELSSPPT